MNRMTAAALSFTFCCVFALPAAAADQDKTATSETRTSTAATFSLEPVALNGNWTVPPVHIGVTETGRGAALPTLYVSLAALQVVDGYTTMTGVKRGALEANPLLTSIARNNVALWAVKGGVTFASIYMAERLWKNHKRGQAIAMMLVSNGLMAAIAAHNASIIGTAR